MNAPAGSGRGGRGAAWLRTLAGPTLVLALGLAAFLLFPDDLGLLTNIIGAAIFLLSLDLVLGYCGVATLGHAALYGAGAYAAGIASVHGLHDPLGLLALAVLAGMLMGLVSGVLIAKGRGLAQLVVSIAVSQLVLEAATKLDVYTGGSDGLTGIWIDPLLGAFAFDLYGRTAFLLSLALLFLVLLLLRRVVSSPFGLLCRGIREDETRVAFMGENVYRALCRMYVISGGVAGLAGGLTAVSTSVVGLDSLGFERSANALVMLLFGGASSLYGAIIGATAFISAEHIVSRVNPFHWLIGIGLMLIVVVIFLPRGLYSAVARISVRLGGGGRR
jgi:branched-chain amino acid transport system permease protein